MPEFKERTVERFRDKLKGGGTRPNLFEVEITPPPMLGKEVVEDDVMRFMIKAAEVPAANIGNIPVPFRGRVLPVAGDRTFDPWTVTVINDLEGNVKNVRNFMEVWSNSINDLQFDGGVTDPEQYQSNAKVFQFGRTAKAQDRIEGKQAGDGNYKTLRAYKFEGIYPNSVSAIPLDYGATDQIEEFQVTFNYIFWNVIKEQP